MAKSAGMTFTPSTTGEEVLEHIKNLFELDRKKRKKEIQAVAEVNASNFIKKRLFELTETYQLQGPTAQQSSQNFQWLSDIMSSVAVDDDKKLRVQEYIDRNYADRLKTRDLENLTKQISLLLETEFKKIRSLKQAYYYRNRSVKAVINFLESEEGADLLRKKLPDTDQVDAWLQIVKERFTTFEYGEKFTRNSYMSEFLVLLHDSWSALTTSKTVDTDKSFDYRVKTALSDLEPEHVATPQLQMAYQQLSSYYEKKVDNQANPRIDLELKHGAVEFKAVKGEGLYAYYKPKKDSIEYLKELEAQVLAESFDHDNLPDIGTQIVTKPGLMLVIKCLGKPSAQTIRDFEQFVGKALR